MTGPLRGVRVLEIAGIGPGPFGCMLLADMGADVIRVDRRSPAGFGGLIPPEHDVLARGRRSIAIDLKSPEGVDVVLRLAEDADVLVEGFRPGVAEGLGIGPKPCRERNPRLVYGRMTGWGQEGPWAERAGHDIDYIAVAGALHPIGRADEPPPVPLNYIGDFGGGGMLLAYGVVCALVERGISGEGQVVDAAMIDGAAAQTAMFHGWRSAGLWGEQRGANMLDGAAPFYRTYACADGEYLAVGALEPQFHAELLEGLGIDPQEWPQYDATRWPEQARQLEDLFASRTRDDWLAVFDGSDACVAPVLPMSQAAEHPQMAARQVLVDHHGVHQPAPAPRFDRTVPALSRPPAAPGADTDEVLAEAGFDEAAIARLRTAGAVGVRAAD